MSLPLSLLICLSVFQLCLGTQPEKRLFREERWSIKSTGSEDVQKVAKFALEMFTKKTNGKMLYKLISVKSAYIQETNVIKYKIDAVFERTQCPKWKTHDVKSCVLNKWRLLCHIVVTLNPGNNEYDLNKSKCQKLANNG